MESSLFYRIIFCALFCCHFQQASASPPELVAPHLEKAMDLAAQKKLHETRAWQKLLHFEKTMLGFYESQVDADDFFNSPNGKYDLLAELKATIASIWKTADAKEEDATACRFPARLHFLKSQLPEVQWPTMSCPRFEKYKKALQGTSVSLIFSSYYLNNPSSAFGHTFLRLNKSSADSSQRHELLDYGLNYAANVNTGNPFIYAVKGLFGFFPGTFTSMPYYFKVREYNDAESRDLWDYELNLSSATVDRMIEHIWELGPTHIDYWYLTENCSYHMLTLIEAADPQWNLTSHLKKYIIPSDTVHAVMQTPGLVKSVRFRPSLRRKLEQRLKMLSPEQKKLVKNFINNPSEKSFPETSSPENLIPVYDTMMDVMDYRFPKEMQMQTPERIVKDQLLLKRSRLPGVSPELTIETPEPEAPHRGTPSRKISLGAGGDQVFLRHKFALHEFLDPQLGYPSYAQIGFFDTEFSFSKERWNIEKFQLLDLISLVPWNDFFRPVSWRLQLGFLPSQSLNHPGNHFFHLSAGPGLTVTPFNGFTFYGGLSAIFETPTATAETRSQLAGGPQALLRWEHNTYWSSVAESLWRYETGGLHRWTPQYSVATQWSYHTSWGFGLRYLQTPVQAQARVEMVGYY